MKEQSLEQIIRDILKGWTNYTIQPLAMDGLIVKSESVELLVYLARCLFSFPYVASVLSKCTICANIQEKCIQITY